MAVIEWTPELELGFDPMDQTHREFVAMLNDMAMAPDDEVDEKLERFIAHTVAHFEQENQWMRLSGFPPIGCHMGEHERVLAILFEVRGMVRTGQIIIARVLATELAAWFENHAATMDHALAYYLEQTGFDVTTAAAKGGNVNTARTA